MVAFYSGAAGMMPDPQGGSADKGEPSRGQRGWTGLGCLNCQVAEQTPGKESQSALQGDGRSFMYQ